TSHGGWRITETATPAPPGNCQDDSTASGTGTLNVSGSPVITSADNTTFAVGVAGSCTVTATGFPAPTFSQSGTLPSGISFNASTHVLSGTAASGTGGAYPITFTATNSQGTATQN